MSQYHPERSLLTETDPDKLNASAAPLTSIKDADYRHQKAALVAGYTSMTEYAIDELITRYRELDARLNLVEGQLNELLER